jgi:hypothetical protein
MRLGGDIHAIHRGIVVVRLTMVLSARGSPVIVPVLQPMQIARF